MTEAAGGAVGALLQMRDISLRFGPVQALGGVDFNLRAGETHVLMGENGAGKSTLLKVLTGVYQPDGGEILLEGQRIKPTSPAHGQSLGISMVYQEVNLVPHLSVAENICLGRKTGAVGFVRHGVMRKRARVALERLGLNLDVSRPVASYSIAIQQMVAIARALDVEAKVLVLDEPTSSLDPGEVERLFAVMRKLREQGMGLVFVTHFLEQVYAMADRITVLRNGKFVGEYVAAELPRQKLVAAMLGREIAEFAKHEAEAEGARAESAEHDVLLTTRGLARKGSVEGVDFTLRRGQTTALAGLLGSGRTEVARLLYGADRASGGTIEIDGRSLRMKSPRQAMMLGFGFCPEDRKTEGIMPDLSVRENMMLALQARQGWLKRIGGRRQRELVSQYIKSLRIATPDGEKPIRQLSGGNQQKVILARWLAARPRLLIMDEPTRGIDVGAKADIEALVQELRNEGMAVVFISSELEETLRVAEQAVVMRDRKQAAVLERGEINEQRVMSAMAGE